MIGFERAMVCSSDGATAAPAAPSAFEDGIEPYLAYDGLFRPISDAAVSGEPLDTDPDYLDFRREAKGTPERTEVLPAPPDSPGAFVRRTIPGEDPDWEQVRNGAITLLGRSHDLVLAGWYCVSLLQLRGLVGLADGLGALRWMLENRWDTLLPLKDDRPGWSEPWHRRVRVFNELGVAVGTKDEHNYQLARRLRRSPLVKSRNAGTYSLESIMVASGKIKPAPGEDAVDQRTIDAAWIDADPGELAATAQAIDAALKRITDIEQIFVRLGNAGPEQLPRLQPVVTILTDARKHVREWLGRRGATADAGATSEPSGNQPAAGAVAAGSAPSGGGSGSPSVFVQIPKMARNANEVRDFIDAARMYYEQDDERRSSPVPLILRLAKGLMGRPYTEHYRLLKGGAIETIEEWVQRLEKPEGSSD